MALTSRSLFLYGFEVNAYNSNLVFNIGGLPITTSITYGYYSLDSLMTEVVNQLSAAAPSRIFTYTINRNVNGGLESRVTITCNTGSFTLDFTQPSSIGSTLGYAPSLYTGSLSYTSTSTPGTALVSEKIGYTYLGPEFQRELMGAVNVSATGVKQAVVFQVMQFISVEFKFEPQSKVISQWTPFWSWAIQQKAFEFTPEILSPDVVYQVTLEKTASSSKGLGFRMVEMLPEFPFYYKTGLITMRRQQSGIFLAG